MKNFTTIILAAGKGTRMKSDLPKVIHEVCGKPIIVRIIQQLKKAGSVKNIVVVGYGSDKVEEVLREEEVEIVYQNRQLGTAHAVSMVKDKLKNIKGDVVVLPGDIFIEDGIMLKKFFAFHDKQEACMSILTAYFENPFGYGRIIRDKNEEVEAIREELDASKEEKLICEINTGIYFFRVKSLLDGLKGIRENKKKKEFYLTDIVEVLRKQKSKICAYLSEEAASIIGVNDRTQLAQIQNILQHNIIKEHQLNGVTVIDPANTYIEDNVKIGRDTIIYPYSYIERDVRIGSDCRIGPFCKIRRGSKINRKAQIGSFVEIVRSKVGEKTNIKHLSYIGDAIIGKRVNIGAGTITANYDGKYKNKTMVKDGAFIGSNTVMVAPVTIGKDAKTGASSVVLKNRNVKKETVVCGIPAKEIKKSKREKSGYER